MEIENKRDLKVSYDINAIKNSIRNILNTLPGGRPLLPDFGCDLRRFIFEQITDLNAKLIGRAIKTSIEKWEPRVRIKNIDITGYTEKHEYVINITLSVPNISDQEIIEMSGVLNRQEYRL